MTRTRWTLALVGATGLVAVGVALGGAPRAPDDAAPTAAPPPSDDATVEPSPTATGPGTTPRASEDGGLFGGLLDDLLGGMDPAALAACVGTPATSPDPLPADPAAAIATIADQVAALRGLDPSAAVDPVLLTPAALRDRVMDLSAEDYAADEADVDARLLAALGAVPPGTDLRALQLDLLGDQVAGFYDPDTGELVAVAQEGLDPTTRMTLAHEIDHALTDQAIGLPDLEGFDGRSDAALATLSVIEGDASLLMQQWALQQLTLMDQLAAAATSLGPAGQLEDVPWVLQQQLVFPYTAGLSFVCEQYAAGGWDAVDALYDAPPTTSAQVLWPERFAAAEQAVDVTDPTLPDRWTEVRRDQLGAADLLWLFQAPGDDRAARLGDAEERAAAWAGGELVVGTRGEDTAVAVTLAERPGATIPLCASVTAWYGAAFPDATATTTASGTTFDAADQAATITCSPARVHLEIGPDAARIRDAGPTQARTRSGMLLSAATWPTGAT